MVLGGTPSGSTTIEAVSHEPSGVVESSSAGSVMQPASKPSQVEVVTGSSSKPNPPSNSGPTAGGAAPVSTMAPSSSICQATEMTWKRAAWLWRAAQASPMPT